MRRIVYALSASLLIILAVALVPALSQEVKPEQPKDDMQKWMELHQPGTEHKWLAEQVGEWTVECKMWKPGVSEPQTSKGSATLELLYDRYLYETGTAGEGETVMKHFGYTAYDMGSKKYQAMYAGNFGTGLKVMDGTRTGNTLTFTCEVNEPAISMKGSSRVVITREGKDKFTVVMHEKINDQPEYKSMEMTYTR